MSSQLPRTSVTKHPHRLHGKGGRVLPEHDIREPRLLKIHVIGIAHGNELGNAGSGAVVGVTPTMNRENRHTFGAPWICAYDIHGIKGSGELYIRSYENVIPNTFWPRVKTRV